MCEPRRALNMDEEGVHLAFEPGDFEVLPGKRARLDRGAVEIFD